MFLYLESDSSLADAFEYVMYGKIYRIEDDKDGKLYVVLHRVC